MESCTVLYSTVLYSTVQYCTVLYSTVQYCTVEGKGKGPLDSTVESLLDRSSKERDALFVV